MTQHYIGTKQIMAWEQDGPKKVKVCGIDCKQGDDACNGYCTGKADRAPAHPPEPGYAVKYEDGYTSWSPKATFEAAYLPMGHVGHLPPHHQRVVGEKVQLDDKIAKLRAFTTTPLFAGLLREERFLLISQLDAMCHCAGILGQRLKALPTYLTENQGLEPVEYFALDDVAKLTEAERLGVFGYDPIAEAAVKAPPCEHKMRRNDRLAVDECAKCGMTVGFDFGSGKA